MSASTPSWPEVTLGQICEFKYGKSLPEAIRTGGNVPVFGSNGQVGSHEVALTIGPTIVIGRKGSTGEVNFSPGWCWPIDTTYYVDGTATQTDVRWLAYRLAALGLTKLNKSVVPGLNREDAYRKRLLLPPLPEQRRIAEVLDRAEALRAKRRAALAQLDTLTQSIFLDMFGDPTTNPKRWPVLRVGEVADVQGGLQVTTARKNFPLEVPYLRVANVYRGCLNLSEIKTIRATDAEIARTKLVNGDLLIVEGHGNPAEIGRGALWDGSISVCIHQNHIIRARFASAKVVPLYACEYLNSPGGRRHLLRAGKTTSGLNTISVSEVRGTPVAVPPISFQREFAHRVTSVETLKTAHRASLAELDTLFASLQELAFSGEL